jgi:hypothetical protein
MTTLESVILSYLVNALWQVPVLFAAGWLAARAIRPLGPGAEHRVWVSVLLLQVMLPAASAIPLEAVRGLLDFLSGPTNNEVPHVSVVMGPGAAFGDPHLPAWVLTLLVIVYAAITAWFVARFAWHLHALRVLRRNAAAATLSADGAGYWARCAERFGVEGASLGTSSQIYGPITIGIRRRLVLLPPEMLAALSSTELRTALATSWSRCRCAFIPCSLSRATG